MVPLISIVSVLSLEALLSLETLLSAVVLFNCDTSFNNISSFKNELSFGSGKKWMLKEMLFSSDLLDFSLCRKKPIDYFRRAVFPVSFVSLYLLYRELWSFLRTFSFSTVYNHSYIRKYVFSIIFVTAFWFLILKKNWASAVCGSHSSYSSLFQILYHYMMIILISSAPPYLQVEMWWLFDFLLILFIPLSCFLFLHVDLFNSSMRFFKHLSILSKLVGFSDHVYCSFKNCIAVIFVYK